MHSILLKVYIKCVYSVFWHNNSIETQCSIAGNVKRETFVNMAVGYIGPLINDCTAKI